jgi:hypothetical protein
LPPLIILNRLFEKKKISIDFFENFFFESTGGLTQWLEAIINAIFVRVIFLKDKISNKFCFEGV